jgi:SPP1 gp7 family putative phage head morphogenesis protein
MVRAWLYPSTAERNYQRLLRSMVKEMDAATLAHLKQMELLRADDWSDDLTRAILFLLESALAIGQRVTARLPEVYAQINQYNDRQWRAVVKAGTGLEIGPSGAVPQGATPLGNVSQPGAIRARFGLGVDVYREEPWLAVKQKNWVAQNSNLIKTIPEQHMARVETIIRQGVMAGESPRSLAEKIKEQGGVTERRAMVIARDQTGKANAELTQARQEDLGIKDYTWVTSHDERVRGTPGGRFPNANPSHYAREGKKFSWKEPPEGGHPGMPIMCRCHARPNFPPAP